MLLKKDMKVTAFLLLLAMCLTSGCANSGQSTKTTSSISDRSSESSKPPQHGEAPPFIYVRGGFVNPGRYAWTNGMKLKDAFAIAGGFNDFAWERIRLKHWDGSTEGFAWSPEKPLTNNPFLKPGDYVDNPRE